MSAIYICRHATTTYRQQFELRHVSNMYLSSLDDNIQTAIWTTSCEQYVSIVTRRQHTDSNLNYVMWAICICRHATTTYRQQFELRHVSNMYLSSRDNIRTAIRTTLCEQYVSVITRQHTDSNLNYVMWVICICRHATTYGQQFELRHVSNMYLSSRDNIQTAIWTTSCEQYISVVTRRQHTDSNLNYVMWAICICRHATTTYRQQFELRHVSNMYLSSCDDNIQTAIWTTSCEQYVSVVTCQHTDSNLNYVMWAIYICRHATITYRQQFELRRVTNMYLSSRDDNIQTAIWTTSCEQYVSVVTRQHTDSNLNYVMW